MASAIIHICVAKKVNEYLKMKEKELFLGTIAPDIAKEINKDKRESHFITTKDSIPNLDVFFSKYKGKLKTAFDYGYFIHLYTDKLWYSKLMTDLVGEDGFQLLESQRVKNNKEVMREIFYKDYTNMNIRLIDKYNLDLTLFYEEFELPSTCIKEIPIKKLNILIDKMGVIIANSHNRRNKVLEYQKVVKFIDETAKEIVTFLENDSI